MREKITNHDPTRFLIIFACSLLTCPDAYIHFDISAIDLVFVLTLKDREERTFAVSFPSKTDKCVARFYFSVEERKEERLGSLI